MTTQELEAERARVAAELRSLPGPKPLKPIPPEVMAELLADQMPYDEAMKEYQSLINGGGISLEPYLDELKRKYPDAQ